MFSLKQWRYSATCLLFIVTLSSAHESTLAEENVSELDEKEFSATQPLSRLAQHPLRSASATAVSLNDALLSSELQAVIRAIPVGVSQSVSKGELLVSLDCADYSLARQLAETRVVAAQARLKLARSQRSRSEQLLAKQLTAQEAAELTQTEAIAREAELQEVQLNLQQAELNVSRCEIRAPFDGIVTSREAAVGQLAAIGTPLLTLVETDAIELSARIEPDDLLRLQDANDIQFDSGRQHPVELMRRGGVVDPRTRNLEIRLSFTEGRPLPGSAGRLLWRDPRAFIPSQYLVRRNGEIGVFIESAGKAEFHAIADAAPGRPAATDLPPETNIVVDRLGSLNDGDTL